MIKDTINKLIGEANLLGHWVYGNSVYGNPFNLSNPKLKYHMIIKKTYISKSLKGAFHSLITLIIEILYLHFRFR